MEIGDGFWRPQGSVEKQHILSQRAEEGKES